MKSFTTLILAASAALTTAQVTYNDDGTFTCAIADAAYCAGTSLQTNIIIRCTGHVGQPGNCNDNLAGEFPQGVSFSPCWQPSATSGQAACSKNCVVYGGSGNYNGTFTLPDCVPIATPSTSSGATLTVTSSIAPSATSSAIATSSPGISYTTITISDYTTVTVPCISGTPIYTPTPVTLTPTSFLTPTGYTPGSTGSAPGPSGNGTIPTTSAGSGPGGSGSATATPVGPTTSAPVTFNGGATVNQAGSIIAAAGLLLAYFL